MRQPMHVSLWTETGLHKTSELWQRADPSTNDIILIEGKSSLPVEGHVGVKNGSSHCFGASVVADGSQAHRAGLTAQAAALLLHVSLHLQPVAASKGGGLRQCSKL